MSPFDIFTLVAVVAIMVALIALFQGTNLGLRMRSAAFAPEVSRLLGISVGRLLTLGWALAATVGALSGVLIAPVVLLSPNFMDAVLVFGFTAAIVGGLESPVGAVVGGIGLGLALSYIGGYMSPDLETVGAFVILIAVLMVRPEGLFGRPASGACDGAACDAGASVNVAAPVAEPIVEPVARLSSARPEPRR